jgi:hypothetical protein
MWKLAVWTARFAEGKGAHRQEARALSVTGCASAAALPLLPMPPHRCMESWQSPALLPALAAPVLRAGSPPQLNALSYWAVGAMAAWPMAVVRSPTRSGCRKP